MPIASLNKFTVPLPNNQSSPTQGLLMPKLKYRFRVTMDGFGIAGTPSTELTKQVISVDRPNVSFAEIKLPVYNSTVKIIGKPEFQNIKLVVRDDSSNAVAGKLGEQLQKQFDFYEQASAVSAMDYKFRMRIEYLDGGNGAFEPVTLECFELLGCIVKGSNYGTHAYDANEDGRVEMEIMFDNALQLDRAGGSYVGMGLNVGRNHGTMAIGG